MNILEKISLYSPTIKKLARQMERTIVCFFTLFIVFIFTIDISEAMPVTFVKEYIYQASELDSKVTCRTVALEQVKRLLLEELGTYLENHTEVKNYELTRDKITTLSAGIVQTQVIDEKWDGKNYWMKAMITADPEAVAKSIDNMRKDHKNAEDLDDIRKKSDDALRETEKLRRELEVLKKDKKTQEKYNNSIEKLNVENRALRKKLSAMENQNINPAKSVPEDKSKRSLKVDQVGTKVASKDINPGKRYKFSFHSAKIYKGSYSSDDSNTAPSTYILAKDNHGNIIFHSGDYFLSHKRGLLPLMKNRKNYNPHFHGIGFNYKFAEDSYLLLNLVDWHGMQRLMGRGKSEDGIIGSTYKIAIGETTGKRWIKENGWDLEIEIVPIE